MPIYNNDLQPLPFFSIGDAKINLAGKEHANAVDQSCEEAAKKTRDA